ncbi:universal stress protein [Solirubrobacter ginsenosidimutans]|uniref:Universal stress protein n=1 Tax=Solirubrobacter ginsenosidimutans TaxID=490573 RepID=A0A9X3MWZ2_9ACTN|nr:universal stress protein [Solirubrobacter ginsenosidimutans]MDA0164349.1 universal stress protein [Solirubrobacter ginsenosidimutans]
MTATAMAAQPTEVLDELRPRRQLVLVDASPNTEITLAAAIAEARRHHATITLLAVVPDIVGDARRCATIQPGVPYPAHLQEAADTDAHQRLHDTVLRIPPDIPVVTAIRHGKPEPAIVAELAARDYDAVVLGAPLHSCN